MLGRRAHRIARRGNMPGVSLPDFGVLAGQPDAQLDHLALAIAAEFHHVDHQAAIAELDALGAELREAAVESSPQEESAACRAVLGERHGFAGDRERYDHPDNSMLDRVLARRRGLPILLSVVYVETARRAGIALAGVGLPGHYVVGHFGADPPLLLDPFSGGLAAGNLPPDLQREGVRPWSNQETALRILNNLTSTFSARADVPQAIRAAELRLELPLAEPVRAALEVELRSLRANLN
jgi:regulator of sirC expression with transglutaminase-like and TPR domain